MFQKRGQVIEHLIWWIIAVGILILVVFLYLLLSGKMSGAVEYIRNLWRFGK